MQLVPYLMSALQHLLRGGADNERITAAKEAIKSLVYLDFSVSH